MAKNPAKSQTRLAPERRAALVADYEAGMPVRAIAAKYGVHRGTIPTLVLRAGASLRTPGLDDAGRARASALYAGGLTLQEVAERFDVDDTTVRSAVIEEGGDIRPRGRRPQVSGR
ncbi:helix-turn-helix domain-containing protein [Microbacterium lacticum]